MPHVAGHPASRCRADHPGRRPGRPQRRSARLNTRAVSLVQRALAGDRTAVARLISLVEKGAPDLPGVMEEVFPHPGHAFTSGLRGAPGAGKSTLVQALITQIRGEGDRVAVLAVDPTSPFSGGALLGDRGRMQGHATDRGGFTPPVAAR